MPRTDWTRNDSIRLGEIAYQVGLTPEDADKAITLGARFLAHGFRGEEIDNMICWQYQQWARDERAVMTNAATVSQARRWWERSNR